jgi:hypothetical protein
VLAAAARRAARARNTLPRLQRYEGYFTLPPECSLLPSTARRAQQLLAAGRAVDALYCLCPGSSSLLVVFAGQLHLHVQMVFKLQPCLPCTSS